MFRAFLFVTTRSLKNRLLHALRRLRQPRYLASFIVAALYFWFMFLRHGMRSVGRPPVSASADVAVDFISIVILAILMIAWALPEHSGGVEFSEAEIAFLFPAPLTRRQLLLYKVFRMQPQVLFSALIMSLIGFHRGRFIGLWAIFAAMSVYFLMVGLARARLKMAGIGTLSRLLAVLAAVTLIGWVFWLDIADGHVRTTVLALQEGKTTAVETPFDGWTSRAILLVPRMFALAAFPGSAAQLAGASAAVVGIGVLCFFFAARLNVSFEDASIIRARKKLERSLRVQQHRVGRAITFKRFPPLFRLREFHPPEAAILWKNLIASMRIASPWIGIIVLPVTAMIAASFFTDEQAIDLMLGTMTLLLAAIFPFVGGAAFGQDLRLDLPRLEVLKSYPITGERLLLSEIAAPLAIVSAIEMLLLTGASAILMQLDKPGALRHVASPEFIVVGLMFAIPVCAMQLLILNAAPILLPAWSLRSKEDARGFAATGQRLLIVFGNVLALSLALVPAAILFALALLLAYKVFQAGPLMLAVATVPSVAVLTLEVWLGIRLLGAQLDRLDVSNEMELVPV